MTTVLYSLLLDGAGRYQQQWSDSVGSLRRHNPHLPVVTCVYGPVTGPLRARASALHTTILEMGTYARVFAGLPPAAAQILAANRSLHKLTSVQRIHQLAPDEAILYLDADTYVFGDLGPLMQRAGQVDWIAREEPGSARSALGQWPEWIDEHCLAAVAAAEGLVFVPAYNTGVFAVSPRLTAVIAGLVDEYFWYVWRLMVGAAQERPDVFFDDAYLAAVRAAATGYPPRQALGYPAGHIWIVEEVATWLLLGRCPGAVLGIFSPDEVAQSTEFLQITDPTLVHYYTGNRDQFRTYLATRHS